MQDWDIVTKGLLLIIDAHTHIGLDKDGSRQTLAELKQSMKSYGIDASIVFPFDIDGDLIAASLELLKQKSDSIIPFLRFDPKFVSQEKIRETLRKGFMGVKLHPRSQDFDPLNKKYYPIFSEIEASGKPLLVHTRKEAVPYSDPDHVVRLADDFPDLNIIIGHFAFSSPIAIDYIKTHKNLYLETSIVSTNTVIRLVSRDIGASKIIFGSDTPMSDQEIELLKIKKSGLDDEEKDKILYKNILSLIK